MTTFTENLDNAKTAQDKYFFEGGGGLEKPLTPCSLL